MELAEYGASGVQRKECASVALRNPEYHLNEIFLVADYNCAVIRSQPVVNYPDSENPDRVSEFRGISRRIHKATDSATGEIAVTMESNLQFELEHPYPIHRSILMMLFEPE